MSLDVNSLNLEQSIDPRLDIQKYSKLLYPVETVGTDNLFRVFPISNITTSGFTVTANPSNNQVFIVPKVYNQIQFVLNFIGTSGGAGTPLLQCPGLPTAVGVSNFPNANEYDAPRAYALSSTISNLAVNLNGSKVDTNLQQYIRALTRYGNTVECQDQDLGYSPTMLDQSLQYSDLNGFARDPLRGYGDNPYQCPRGGFINAVVTRNDSSGLPGDQAQVVLTLMEPVYLSPFSNACDGDEPSFIQLNTLSETVTFAGRGTNNQSLISTLWSHSTLSPSVFTSFTVTVPTNASNLIYLEIQPPLDMVIPQTIVYPYIEPYYVQTEKGNAVPAGTITANVAFDNIQLSSIPERVYMWVSKRDQDYSWTDTDTYFQIQQVNITFNTKPGILSTATPEMLYNISVRNKTNSNYRQFVRDVGSVLCLRFGEDIPLNNLLAPGSRGSYNFTGNVTIKNNYVSDVVPSINFLFMYSGTFTISNGRCIKNIGLLTENNVLATKQSNELPVPAPAPVNALGSGFGSGKMIGGFSFKNFLGVLKRVGRLGINAAKFVTPLVAPQYTPAVAAADFIAKKVGFGSAVGGKKLSRKQMLKMLEHR